MLSQEAVCYLTSNAIKYEMLAALGISKSDYTLKASIFFFSCALMIRSNYGWGFTILVFYL